jgi:hypothetical protein
VSSCCMIDMHSGSRRCACFILALEGYHGVAAPVDSFSSAWRLGVVSP